jgi:hypothetical protein
VHDLRVLARYANLERAIGVEANNDQQFGAHWLTAQGWNEQSRYQLGRSALEAQNMFDAVARPATRSASMAETTLVEPKIRAGAELLEELDSRLGDVFAAFWYRDPEAEDWRLVIGSDVVDREGPTAANRRLLEALPQLREGWSNWMTAVPEISPLEIELVGRRHPLVEMLRTLSTQPMTLRTPLHIYRTVLGNHYVDDAYVYRSVIRPTAIASQEVLGSPTIMQSPPPERRRSRTLAVVDRTHLARSSSSRTPAPLAQPTPRPAWSTRCTGP